MVCNIYVNLRLPPERKKKPSKIREIKSSIKVCEITWHSGTLLHRHSQKKFFAKSTLIPLFLPCHHNKKKRQPHFCLCLFTNFGQAPPGYFTEISQKPVFCAGLQRWIVQTQLEAKIWLPQNAPLVDKPCSKTVLNIVFRARFVRHADLITGSPVVVSCRNKTD